MARNALYRTAGVPAGSYECDDADSNTHGRTTKPNQCADVMYRGAHNCRFGQHLRS